MRVYEVNENMGLNDVAFVRINDNDYGMSYGIAVRTPDFPNSHYYTILTNLDNWEGRYRESLSGLGFTYMWTNRINNFPLDRVRPEYHRGIEVLGEDVDITTCYSSATIQALILRGYLGRQMTNPNDRLGLYDWAILESDRNQVGILFQYRRDASGFYHQGLCGLDGARVPIDSINELFPLLHHWSNYSWYLGNFGPIGIINEYLNDNLDNDTLHLVGNRVDLHTILRENRLIASTETTSTESTATTTESTRTTTQRIEVTDFISNKYTKDVLYTGQQSYHYHHSSTMNEPKSTYKYRIGIELEVEFNSDSERRNFNSLESNWFYRESDGSLGSNGCEIITIPLLPKDAMSVDFWNPLINYLNGKAKSWETNRCGLHVHIGREILGRTEEQQSETLGKLLYLYHHYIKDTRLNIKIFGRERGYNDRDGKTDVGNACKTLGSSVLKDKIIKERVKDSMISKAHEARYFDINIANYATIEFRKGKGSIKSERIAMVVEYCDKMCVYAKNTPWMQISYLDFVAFLKSTTTNEQLIDHLNSWS